MDYEKAYNEAIKRAKAIIEVAEKEEEVYKSAITIFPELRESEDERIREEFCKDIWNFIPNEKAHKYISWLAKQGETFTKKDVDDAYLKGICDAKHELEKQGEPTDKEKTKFHEGEWIISNDKKSTYQVIEVKRGIYVIRDNADNHEYHIGIEECEKSGRLFTIQDAKDGDVLAEDTCTFIIKKLNHDLTAGIYCCLYDDGDFELNSNLGFDDRCTYPATKSQRDTLFAKMKEAGYEWDFEKKELKKLSQRMISAEVKEALYDKPTDEEMKELLRTEYEKGRADTLSEMKSSWSEEDEKRLLSCINILKAKSLMGKVDTANTMWLKSLKQRIGG